jgi:hypothetical protein
MFTAVLKIRIWTGVDRVRTQLGLGIRIQIHKGINGPKKEKRKKLQYIEKLDALLTGDWNAFIEAIQYSKYVGYKEILKFFFSLRILVIKTQSLDSDSADPISTTAVKCCGSGSGAFLTPGSRIRDG